MRGQSNTHPTGHHQQSFACADLHKAGAERNAWCRKPRRHVEFVGMVGQVPIHVRLADFDHQLRSHGPKHAHLGFILFRIDRGPTMRFRLCQSRLRPTRGCTQYCGQQRTHRKHTQTRGCDNVSPASHIHPGNRLLYRGHNRFRSSVLPPYQLPHGGLSMSASLRDAPMTGLLHPALHGRLSIAGDS